MGALRGLRDVARGIMAGTLLASTLACVGIGCAHEHLRGHEAGPVAAAVEPTPDAGAPAVAAAPAEVPHGILFGEVEPIDAVIFQKLVLTAAEHHAHRLVLRIDTQGGSQAVAGRLAWLMDVARDHGVRVDCVVDGFGWSAGYFVLQACDRRYMTKRSTLMTHNPLLKEDSSRPGSLERRNNEVMLAAVAYAWAEGCRAKMRVTLEDYLRRVAGGAVWAMTWQDALQYGAVDAVLDDPRTLWAGGDR